MGLSERKIRILEAIINDYIATAEPIGSRTIAKKYDLGISSATIRNEMSDLYDLGLIIQPHTSSGRIPSDQGYRLYVDSLMRYRELTENEAEFLQKTIASDINQIDYLMKKTAEALSILTNYTTIISSSQSASFTIKHIQLMPFDGNKILLILVTDTKTVKNIVVNLPEKIEADELANLSSLLNEKLAGKSTDEISELRDTKDLGVSSEVLAEILAAISLNTDDENDVSVYASGVKNILSFPEFSNVERAKEIFNALEEKRLLKRLLGDGKSPSRIEIIIGCENNIAEMQNCSIIKANIRVGTPNPIGSIGIIGPTRMNYHQVASILNGIVKRINSLLETFPSD
ncbi:heat-inducible transcription repressor HrcA [Clostridia bacterium]|nr:heat-inducible transcription repressor HrcA [Clostridia bacterium]GHU74730.1 heat-inducible transcription repressor HrcA [Clostridia bacterium]